MKTNYNYTQEDIDKAYEQLQRDEAVITKSTLRVL